MWQHVLFESKRRFAAVGRENGYAVIDDNVLVGLHSLTIAVRSDMGSLS